MNTAQGCGYVASLASGTLGALVQSEAVRSSVLEGIGTRPIVRMLARTDIAVPGKTLKSRLQTLARHFACLACICSYWMNPRPLGRKFCMLAWWDFEGTNVALHDPPLTAV